MSGLIYAFRWAGSRSAASLVVSPGGSGTDGSPLYRPAGPQRDLLEGAAAPRRGLDGAAAFGAWPGT